MTTFLLIRHAENDYLKKAILAGRLPGIHLNAKGQQQAEKLAQALAETPIKAVYSSPLERAVETGKPLAKAHDLKVLKRLGLAEVDFGEWEGKSLRRLPRNKLWRVVQHSPSLMRFPGGESFLEAQQRIVNELEAMRRSHKPKDVVACISHGDMIKLAVAYYLGLPLDLFQRVMVFPASVTTLALSESSARLVNLNHLPEPPSSE